MQAEINGLMMAKKNSAVLWTVDQTGDVIGKDGRTTAQDNVGLGSDFVKSAKTDNAYVTHVSRDSTTGNLVVNTKQPELSELKGLDVANKNQSIITDSQGNIVNQALSATQQTAQNTTTSFVSAVTQNGNGSVVVTTSPITSAAVNTAGIVPLIDDITNVDGTIVTNKEDHAVTPLGVKSAIDMLPDADVFVATYSTQSSGTTLAELETAYLAGKKIVIKMAGAIGNDQTEETIPLSYVQLTSGSISGFYFESQVDPVVNEAQAGTMVTYYRRSDGWGYKLGSVAYASGAGEANQANYAKGYVEGEGIATALAGKMDTNANNAASGALQKLTGQLMSGSSVDVGPFTEIYGSYTSGFNSPDHVNEPYKYTLEKLWGSYISGQTEALYARRPFVKVLSDPKYYQDGAVHYVKVFSNNNDASAYMNYRLLANRTNAPGGWGIVTIPDVESENPYVEIDFDIELQSTDPTDNIYYIPPLINNKYPWPYLLTFCAAIMNQTTQTPLQYIPDGYSTIFAVSTLCVGDILGDTRIYGHVRLSGFVPVVAEHDTYCIILGARSGLGSVPTNGCYFRIKTTNVKVVISRHIFMAD